MATSYAPMGFDSSQHFTALLRLVMLLVSEAKLITVHICSLVNGEMKKKSVVVYSGHLILMDRCVPSGIWTEHLPISTLQRYHYINPLALLWPTVEYRSNFTPSKHCSLVTRLFHSVAPRGSALFGQILPRRFVHHSFIRALLVDCVKHMYSTISHLFTSITVTEKL